MTKTERMKKFCEAGLYFVTSEIMSEGRGTLDIVDQVLRAGVKLIQLREKHMSRRNLYELSRAVRKKCLDHDALLIINDHLDIAMSVNADGVHLGQDDFPVDAAVRLAPEMIVGASTHNIEEAILAQQQGCSYLNIGPIYPTGTKNWEKEYLGLNGLDEIAAHVKVPFTVMGGIKEHHIKELREHGAHTIALVTAITAAPNPKDAAEKLLFQIQK